MFQIRKTASGDIRVSGRFDAARVDEARELLDTIVESVAIDFKDLDYISSAGLGLLWAMHKRLKDMGETLIIRNLSGHIADVFRLTGMDKHIEIK